MTASLENDCLGPSPNNSDFDKIYVRPHAVGRVDRTGDMLRFFVHNAIRPVTIRYRSVEAAKGFLDPYTDPEKTDFIRVDQGEGLIRDGTDVMNADEVHIRHSTIVRAERFKRCTRVGALINIYLCHSPNPILLAYDSDEHASAALRAIWEGRQP